MAKQKSITSNFIYNILLTLSAYIAQLIVYPYVSRVLGVDNMGIIGFVNKTIDIFLIFSTLGISTVGVREIAAARNNKEEMSRVFSLLVTFGTITSLVVSVVYLGAILWITKFNVYSNLFLIGLAKLIFSNFLIQWLYTGTENFRYITIRTLIIKVLYIISVFVFVREQDDYTIYFSLTIASTVLNGLINWLFSRKLVRFRFRVDGIRQYFKPMFTFGLYHMLNATFSTCNYMFLGFIATKTEVGYYYTAENFYFILLAGITAFTRVMLPRMSSLIADDKKEEFDSLVNKSFDAILSVCLPIAIFGVFFASGIIGLFSGQGYEGAVVPMQIMMALIVINGINQIFIVQIATPLRLDKEILIGTAVATVVALGSNYFMIKYFGAIGCSIVLVISVVVANVYPIYCLLKRKYMKLPVRLFVRHILAAIPYVLICVLAIYFGDNNSIISMIVAASCFAIYFFLYPGKAYVVTYWNRFVGNKFK